jgi:tripartite-type tricarboxylate transporter receptor subunit TctC
MKKLVAFILVAAGVLFYSQAALQAAEQNYPRKMVQVIVPTAAGGNLDLVARSMAQSLTKGLGQQFIVENRASFASLVGTQLVARSVPDGYTLLIAHSTTVTAPSIALNAGYDPVKDFVGVSQTCWLPLILVTRTTLPVKSVKELIAYARANPGKLTVAHAGLGTSGHMAWEMFNQMAGGDLQVLKVPYKGSAPALIDVLGGQIDVFFDTFSTSIQHVKAGKIRALGLAGNKRSPIFPDLPTVAEAGGMPGYDPSIFNGIVAPAGTPRDVLVTLQREIAKTVKQPEIHDRFQALGVDLTASDSPEQFTEFLRQQTARMSKIVRDAGIKPE